MKVLWVTNTVFPELAKALGQNTPVVGGWMYGLANNLSKNGVELIVATARKNAKPFSTKIEGITYYLLAGKKPAIDCDESLDSQWKKIIADEKPNIVHIHGTEYGHGLSLMKIHPNLNYLISIQGLISVYARYYTGHIPYDIIKKNSTLRDLFKNDGILMSQKKFHKRGELVEKQYFHLGKHFTGRTQWDYDHTVTLNKNSSYHFCNESLRDGFYNSKKWSFDSIERHSIFLSQAIYPIKGLHQVLRALNHIKDDFPSMKIRIAGGNITKTDTLKDRLTMGGYGKYLLSLINELGLKEQIEFTGPLDEFQMIKEYLNCNLFICPSSIENSPNSLGEAQLLGVPTIASYVGGIPDMVNHGITGLLYRYEEVEMLAQQIKNIFESDKLAKKLSLGGIEAATIRHNRDTNLNTLLDIYKRVQNG